MNLSEMRMLFEAGALQQAILANAPMGEGFVMLVRRTDGKEEYMTVAKEERHKVYKSLEAARADAKRIGFKEVLLQVA